MPAITSVREYDEKTKLNRYHIFYNGEQCAFLHLGKNSTLPYSSDFLRVFYGPTLDSKKTNTSRPCVDISVTEGSVSNYTELFELATPEMIVRVMQALPSGSVVYLEDAVRIMKAINIASR